MAAVWLPGRPMPHRAMVEWMIFFRPPLSWQHKGSRIGAHGDAPTCAAPQLPLHHDLRGGQMADDRIRRPMDSRQAAEAAFKKATTKPPEPVAKQPSIANAKELVSLRIDRDVLEYFQESGPGWQDRINEALKRVAGK